MSNRCLCFVSEIHTFLLNKVVEMQCVLELVGVGVGGRVGVFYDYIFLIYYVFSPQ